MDVVLANLDSCTHCWFPLSDYGVWSGGCLSCFGCEVNKQEFFHAIFAVVLCRPFEYTPWSLHDVLDLLMGFHECLALHEDCLVVDEEEAFFAILKPL